MDVLFVSLAPVAIIAFYIWFRDKYEHEPVRMLVYSLITGVLIVFPVIFVEGILSEAGKPIVGLASVAWTGFAVAGFTEELFKFIALLLLVWRNPNFNEKYDGIVYGTFVSLGFAGVENVLYVMQDGFATGMARAFTAVPAHAIFGITMGFFFGMAKFYPRQRGSFLLKAFLLPVLLHGMYDFILMAEKEWLWIIFFLFVAYLYFSGFKRMKKLSDLSIFRTDYDLLNKKFGGEGAKDENT